MSRTRASVGLVWLASLLGGCAKEAPAASERMRPTAEPAPERAAASATAPVVPALPVTASMASYPNGYAFVGRAAECRVSMLGRAASERWDYALGDCGGALAVAVAPNSVAFARTAAELIAFAPDGKRAWAASVGRVPPELLQPTVTLDSVVVTATSTTAVVAFRPDGTPAWNFKLEGEEKLTAAPRRSESEGVLLVTGLAVYALAPDGTVRFRTAFAGPL